MLKVRWLGQAGLWFSNNNCSIVIDPYLSDSCLKLNSENWRRIPVNSEYLDKKYDIAIFTHNHMDHFDIETSKKILCGQNSVTVLSPQSVWNEARKLCSNNNYILFNRHTSFTQKGILFTAVKAEHSDPYSIGVIIDDGEEKYYITGDTLYNCEIFEDIPEDIDVLFLPVNGRGNNMNFVDAKRFSEKINPRIAVPLHIGTLDDISAEKLDIDNLVIPKPYEIINL